MIDALHKEVSNRFWLAKCAIEGAEKNGFTACIDELDTARRHLNRAETAYLEMLRLKEQQ